MCHETREIYCEVNAEVLECVSSQAGRFLFDTYRRRNQRMTSGTPNHWWDEILWPRSLVTCARQLDLKVGFTLIPTKYPSHSFQVGKISLSCMWLHTLTLSMPGFGLCQCVNSFPRHALGLTLRVRGGKLLTNRWWNNDMLVIKWFFFHEELKSGIFIIIHTSPIM